MTPYSLKRSAAAQILGVSPEQMRYYEWTGQLRTARTTGGHRLFNRADVLALAARRAARMRTRARQAARRVRIAA
jgi:DNA-binding transcriptional MerR regulator